MYKVFYKEQQDTNLFFAIEYQLQRVKDYKEADIIAITDINECQLYTDAKCKIFLILDLWHGSENGCHMYKDYLIKYNKLNLDANLIILSQYQMLADQYSNTLTYDFLFNRSKAYFSNFPIPELFHNNANVWYWSGELSYQIKHWTRKPEYRTKVFCSYGRTYPNQRPHSIRHELAKFVQQYEEIGYVGFVNSDDNQEISLYSHKEDPLSNGSLVFDVNNCSIIDNRKLNLDYPGDRTRGFSPPHVNYFEDSFITIYGETIEYGNTLFITEKTFTPLIHGHFILPFSNCGFVNLLKEYKFKFPDFINYSYDDEKDYKKRSEMYFQECARLLKLPRAYWVEQFKKNADLRFYNRQLFWTKPYDQLIPKLQHYI